MALFMLFVDGLGLQPPTPSNPIYAYDLPVLQGLLQGEGQTFLLPTDASMGVSGLPQSATGQTALLTGRNPFSAVSTHKSGFPGPTLRNIIAKHSVFRQIRALGGSCTFANAYTRSFSWQNIARASVSTCSVLAASLPFRLLDDLKKERAVYQECTNEALRRRGYEVPLWSPAKGGSILVNIAKDYDFTLYEYFQTDLAGHSQDPVYIQKVLEDLEELLASILNHKPDDMTLLLTSDHGNIEDSSTRGHTLNKVPCVVVGPDQTSFTQVENLTHIVPAVLRALYGKSLDRRKVTGAEDRN